jgi:hypothetical protein
MHLHRREVGEAVLAEDGEDPLHTQGVLDIEGVEHGRLRPCMASHARSFAHRRHADL